MKTLQEVLADGERIKSESIKFWRSMMRAESQAFRRWLGKNQEYARSSLAGARRFRDIANADLSNSRDQKQ